MLTLLNMLHLFGLNITKTRFYTQNIVKRLYNTSNLHETIVPPNVKEELQFMNQNHNIKFNPNMKSPNASKNLNKKCPLSIKIMPRHNHLCFIKDQT
jgi:hypothetical protein